MGARRHDQDLGLLGRLASDLGQFVDGQIGQVVASVYARLRELGDQFRGQPLDVAQVLRHLFHVLFAGDVHGQQRIFGPVAQLIDGVLVKRLDLKHFLQRHIGDLFQAGETLGDQNVGNLLVDIELVHEKLARRIGLAGLLLGRLVGGHDVDLPARQVRGQAHVLPPAADRDGEVFLVDHHIHRVLFLVNHDGLDIGRRQSANDKLGRIFAPQHDVHPLARQFVGHRVDAGAAHTDAGANWVDPLVVREHCNLGA